MTVLTQLEYYIVAGMKGAHFWLAGWGTNKAHYPIITAICKGLMRPDNDIDFQSMKQILKIRMRDATSTKMNTHPQPFNAMEIPMAGTRHIPTWPKYHSIGMESEMSEDGKEIKSSKTEIDLRRLFDVDKDAVATEGVGMFQVRKL
jgi:hypothetical protein